MPDLDSQLNDFFDGRTLGYLAGQWLWRGGGYDDGWILVESADLAQLHLLLGEGL